MTLPGKVFRGSIEVIMNCKPSTACASHVGLSLLSIVVTLKSPCGLCGLPLISVQSRNTATNWISAKWWTLHSNLIKRRAIDPGTSRDKLSHRGESVVVHVRRGTPDRFEMPMHLTTFCSWELSL